MYADFSVALSPSNNLTEKVWSFASGLVGGHDVPYSEGMVLIQQGTVIERN
jgi:hypothetical protein